MGILITLTATNANNQSTQLARLSISGDREVCPEACWFILPRVPRGQNAQRRLAFPPAIALRRVDFLIGLNYKNKILSENRIKHKKVTDG